MIVRALVAWAVSAGAALAQVPADDVVSANAEFTLWHQVARAMSAQNGYLPGPAAPRPILHALGRIGAGDTAEDVERILLVAETWLVAERDGRAPPYFRNAQLDGELARQAICYVADEGPGRAHMLLAEWGPPRNAAACATDMAAALEEAEAFLDRAEDPVTGLIEVETAGAQDPLASEVMDLVADLLRGPDGPPEGLHLKLAPCGRVDALYVEATQTVTLCTELMDAYRLLAREIARE